MLCLFYTFVSPTLGIIYRFLSHNILNALFIGAITWLSGTIIKPLQKHKSVNGYSVGSIEPVTRPWKGLREMVSSEDNILNWFLLKNKCVCKYYHKSFYVLYRDIGYLLLGFGEARGVIKIDFHFTSGWSPQKHWKYIKCRNILEWKWQKEDTVSRVIFNQIKLYFLNEVRIYNSILVHHKCNTTMQYYLINDFPYVFPHNFQICNQRCCLNITLNPYLIFGSNRTPYI